MLADSREGRTEGKGYSAAAEPPRCGPPTSKVSGPALTRHLALRAACAVPSATAAASHPARLKTVTRLAEGITTTRVAKGTKGALRQRL